MVLSTHIVSDVELIADKVILLNNGTLLAADRVNDLLHNLKGMVWSFCLSSKAELQEMSDECLIGNVIDCDIQVRVVSRTNRIKMPFLCLLQWKIYTCFIFKEGIRIEFVGKVRASKTNPSKVSIRWCYSLNHLYFFWFFVCAVNHAATFPIHTKNGCLLEGRQAALYNKVLYEQYAGELTDEKVAEILDDFQTLRNRYETTHSDLFNAP